MSSGELLIIVAGAGRSGTSAVARVLHESGVRMGRRMAEATEANPEGFYEDTEVVELNERILTGIGLNDPWRPERWPSRATVRAAGARYHNEMSALSRTGISGWKDPRFAITLEAWLPALPQPPRIVVCLRSPHAYADSVMRIYGLVKPARAMREWARHYRRLLAVIQRHGLHATCIEYDALIEKTEQTVGRLSIFVGRKLDASLVVPRLRREAGCIPGAYQTLYDNVAALSGMKAHSSVTGHAPRIVAQVATADYHQRAASISTRLRIAHDTWQFAVAMPSLTPTKHSQDASTVYNALLVGLQQEVTRLVPPDTLSKQHARLVRRINLDRMIAELVLAAITTGDPRTHEAAVRGWQKFRRE